MRLLNNAASWDLVVHGDRDGGGYRWSEGPVLGIDILRGDGVLAGLELDRMPAS